MYDLQQKYGIAVCTTETLPGHQLTGCFGLVHGTAIYGANFMKDFFARARDKIGGRVASYENTMQGAHRAAVEMMLKQAADLDANAILGVRIVIETCGDSMMMASCCGTAVAATRLPTTNTGLGQPR